MPMPTQRYGVFLNVENPDGNERDALEQTVRTAVAADELGFHDVWVAEHHYNPFAVGSALMVLLAQIAACTARIRLGTGASLLSLNDPVRVAEDVAALDLLSGGRLEFGVARGGPFPEQYRVAGLASADAARARMHEALALIRRLWCGEAVNFAGDFFRCTGLRVYPRPLQRPMPIWLASLGGDSPRLAEEHGYGLMATPSADLDHVAYVVAAEREKRGVFPFAIARFFYCEEDDGHAVAHGLEAVRAYPGSMGTRFAEGSTPPMFEPRAADRAILDNAIIGGPEQCAEQVARLRDLLGPHRLLLKPATHDPRQARAALALFANEFGLNRS